VIYYIKTITHPLVIVSLGTYATRRKVKAQESRAKGQGLEAVLCCAVLCCVVLP
jgi:hypothetical protein